MPFSTRADQNQSYMFAMCTSRLYMLSVVGSKYRCETAFNTMNNQIMFQPHQSAPIHVYENGPDTISVQI